ncbi:MAG: DNA translocase FtsK 4TM domain-containing protein [Patescibacteria group bacterium]
MAKKDRKKSSETTTTNRIVFKELQDSTMQSVFGILFLVAAVFFLLASFHKGGIVGNTVYEWLNTLLGLGYYLLPVLLFMLSVSFFSEKERRFPLSKTIGSIMFFLSGLGIFSLVKVDSGGVIGNLISNPLVKLFEITNSYILLLALLIISILVIFDSALKLHHVLFWRMFKKDMVEGDADIDDDVPEIIAPVSLKKTEPLEAEAEAQGMMAAIKRKLAGEDKGQKDTEDPLPVPADDMIKVSKKSMLLGKSFVPPPLSLLENDKGKPGVGDIKANANIIKRTLQNFGIDVEMDEISIGPSVTRYALKPAEGVKLSRILGLQNNLALALAAHPIRIEAPIPGKSLVGIEIPNSVKTTVGLGTLLAHEDFQKNEKPLMVALGKGISGKSYFENLAKMPHMLVAGATGSGKSVTIHAIITSLLYRNSPDNLRFIMVDPKRVELTLYDKIPHLLTPVIKDAKKAILSLKWAAKEMDRRYDILEKNSVRDIDSYHKTILMPALEKVKGQKDSGEEVELPDTMPYIVIVIDELADIMQTYPRELESAIVRLAQMSRAVGIHLILSTQRPSVNVITGLIKANVPARIALQVASQIDSRTILDTRGAEELLGAGDMLFFSGQMSAPVRIQSAFITEGEIKKVVKYLVDNSDSLPQEIVITGESVTNGSSGVNDPVFNSSFDDMGDPAEDDDLYVEAKDIVIKAGKASTSYIQRKLRVGYARAARLMDILEERGVIGPSDGSKPREVMAEYLGTATGTNSGGIEMPDDTAEKF